jgi:acyl carrier protein
MTEPERIVRGFITSNFVAAKARTGLRADESLMTSGILDSTGVLELTAFLESQFEITVADEDLTPDNLDTISNILGYLARKTGKD